jgi:hypothetical protein
LESSGKVDSPVEESPTKEKVMYVFLAHCLAQRRGLHKWRELELTTVEWAPHETMDNPQGGTPCLDGTHNRCHGRIKERFYISAPLT